MPLTLQIAAWQVPTAVFNYDDAEKGTRHVLNALSCLDAAERCRLLEETIGVATAKFDRWKATGPVMRVFAAPEFYFAATSRRHFVDEDVKSLIVKRVAAMSERAPGVVLVPGSIPWKQPLKRATSPLNLIRDSRREKAVDRFEANRKLVSGNVDLSSRTNEFSKKVQGTLDDATHAGFNSAFVYRDGKRLLRYDKRLNGGEVSDFDYGTGRSRRDPDVVFVPGATAGTFTVDGVAFGLEMCTEHAERFLLRTSGSVDVQIVISSQMSLQRPAFAVRDGGVVIHADTADAPSVWQRSSGTFTRVDEGALKARPVLSQSAIDRRVDRYADEQKLAGRPLTDERRAEVESRLAGRVGLYSVTLP